MSAALIIDTETTGIDEPEVIELAWIGPLPMPRTDLGEGCLRFKPAKPISLGAMAAHHIIADDLADCPPWAGWSPPAECEYIVGHNIDFDWRAIGSPNVKRICTLAMARQAWPTLDSHSLSALIYHLYPHSKARQLVQRAHNAQCDVRLCFGILEELHEFYGKPCTWEQVWQISEQARIPTHMSFGKHKGTAIKDVPRDYKQWLLRQPDVDPYLMKALQS